MQCGNLPTSASVRLPLIKEQGDEGVQIWPKMGNRPEITSVNVSFFLKIRHHNKVLTCEVHGDGANEQRYISICYNICPGVRAMQKYMAVSVSLGGRQQFIHSRAARAHEHRGGPVPWVPKPISPRPKVGMAMWGAAGRGHVWGVPTCWRPKVGGLVWHLPKNTQDR